MTFEIIKGDLFDPAHKFNALAQGVNTKGVMGAGIAVAFRERFPAMYAEYQQWCSTYESVLPGLLHAFYPQDGGVHPSDPAVYNLFSQIHPGKDGSYELLERATFLMRIEAEDALTVFLNYEDGLSPESRDIIDGKFRVGLPWIGCGIAGLAKHNVENIFRRYLSDSVDVEFVLVEQ
jgi:O-acetyl-ADP-ribose deacetylase (regulator of RNase III)